MIGAQEEANRLHELRQGAVSELSRLRYAEEELEQVDSFSNCLCNIDSLPTTVSSWFHLRRLAD